MPLSWPAKRGTRHWRQRGEGLQVGEFVGQAVDHPFDEKIAETDADEAFLGVADRIEYGSVGLGRVFDRGLLVEKVMDVAGHAAYQRHFDENQRLVGHPRVEEGVQTAVQNRVGSSDRAIPEWYGPPRRS